MHVVVLNWTTVYRMEQEQGVSAHQGSWLKNTLALVLGWEGKEYRREGRASAVEGLFSTGHLSTVGTLLLPVKSIFFFKTLFLLS